MRSVALVLGCLAVLGSLPGSVALYSKSDSVIQLGEKDFSKTVLKSDGVWCVVATELSTIRQTH